MVEDESKDTVVRDSLINKEEAEARMADAHADKFSADTRLAVATAEREEIRLFSERRDEAKKDASDELHRIYQFNSSVDASSVKSCITQLSTWHRQGPGNLIEIVFHSPGGSVIDGMALFDYIKYIQNQGTDIDTMTLGMAASMAGILLQAGTKRIMGKEAWVLIHQGSFGAVGSVGQVEDTVEWVKRIQKRILNIFAERATLTAKQIAKRWERKDWWLDSEECLKLGLIDEIR